MNESRSLPRVVSFDFNKHLPQSSAHKTSDLFFILSTVFMVTQEEKEVTQITLEKTLFKISLFEEDYSFFNTFFFINTYGPHNNIFYKYLDELERAGLIEFERRSIYLTAKGLSTASEMLEEISNDQDLQKVLIALKKQGKIYSKFAIAVEETHSLKVIDTTDNNKQKTIEELIREIKPEQQFTKGSQFKYIEPPPRKKVKKIKPPSKVINRLESVLAGVESPDFEQDSKIDFLFK